MECQPTMEARISVVAGVVWGALAIVAGPGALAGQHAARADTTAFHFFGGQPFRLDGMKPWRRGGPAVSLQRGSSSLPGSSASGQPFRLRGGAAADGSSGMLSALADLLMPVRGVRQDQLHDSFGSPRDGHRHEGIDIFAPRGAPVVAAVDGTVARLKWDVGGGRTIREIDGSGKYVLYYAHLSGYVRGLREGQTVRRGQVIGYVGRTGTVHGSSHLHLGIAALLDGANRWWRVRPLNPYALLRRALGAACDSTAAADCGAAEPAAAVAEARAGR
jgi:murein DD-endopeptidase MepM/ murein hydrolase activator NlpD